MEATEHTGVRGYDYFENHDAASCTSSMMGRLAARLNEVYTRPSWRMWYFEVDIILVHTWCGSNHRSGKRREFHVLHLHGACRVDVHFRPPWYSFVHFPTSSPSRELKIAFGDAFDVPARLECGRAAPAEGIDCLRQFSLSPGADTRA